MAALVEVKDICKIYNPGENEVRALDHVSVSIQERNLWRLSVIPARANRR